MVYVEIIMKEIIDNNYNAMIKEDDREASSDWAVECTKLKLQYS